MIPMKIAVFLALLPTLLSDVLTAQTPWLQIGTGSPTDVSAAYDSDRDRIVAQRFSETFEYDGSTWTRTAVSPLAPNDYCLLCYDPLRRRTVFYGLFTDETWEYDGTSWTQVDPGGSYVTGDGTVSDMVFHAVRSRVVRLSYRAVTNTYDLWEWDGIAWRVVPTPVPLPTRGYRNLTYDLDRNRLVLFGEIVTTFPTTLIASTWEWDQTSGWQQILGVGGPAILHSRLTYDQARRRQILITNPPVTPPTQGIWERDGIGPWVNMNITAPTNLTPNSNAVFDSRRSRIVTLSWDQTFWSYGPVNPATYVPHGGGCAGPVFAPLLTLSAPWNVPWLGNTMQIEVRNAPLGLAFLTTGLDDQFAGTSPLPLDLTSLGMTGCSLRVEPLSTRLLTSPSTRVITFFPIPSSQALLGVRFFQQAATPDPAANGIGMTMTNSMAAVVGTW